MRRAVADRFVVCCASGPLCRAVCRVPCAIRAAPVQAGIALELDPCKVFVNEIHLLAGAAYRAARPAKVKPRRGGVEIHWAEGYTQRARLRSLEPMDTPAPALHPPRLVSQAREKPRAKGSRGTEQGLKTVESQRAFKQPEDSASAF